MQTLSYNNLYVFMYEQQVALSFVRGGASCALLLCKYNLQE